MPQKPLPIECLLEILRILSQEHDTNTMAQLLCVNKTFCAATLPFLYGDCFNSSMHRRSNKTPEQSMLLLIRSLLRQVHPQGQIPGLLRAAYLSKGPQDNPRLIVKTPVFKYSHFVRKFVPYEGFEKSIFTLLRKSVVDYADTHHLYEKYTAEGLFFNIHAEHEDEALECALKMDLERQLMWTLCQENAGTVEELAIPFIDIQRYIDHVCHFTSLSRVEFTVPDIVWRWIPMRTFITQGDWNQLVKGQQEWQEPLIRATVRFVQRHTFTHNNVLQSVKVPSLPKTSNQDSIIDAQFEILSLLPPLQNPRSIDILNLYELAARLSDINLSCVESITLPLSCKTEKEQKALQLLVDQPPFLPRCRGLKRLVMETLGPDMFHWAVLEKKHRDAGLQQKSSVGPYLSSREHGCHSELVPLQFIMLINRANSALVQELNDIATAFSDSLEDLAVSCGANWTVSSTYLDATPEVAHGRGWDLPRLRTLSLEVNYFQLHFDLDALQRFHALESLCLGDSITTYNHRDIRSWPSIHLPRLKILKLTGSPALRFNMDSLHHLPCLEDLALGIVPVKNGLGRYCLYIPSPEDLQRDSSDDDELSGAPETASQLIGKRPRWSWDWYLPTLNKLDLGAVFAYKFDFGWLKQLPNLQQICLDTRSSEYGVHERDITLKDLLREEQEPEGDGGGHILSDRYISLPKLESIFVNGDWTFDEKVTETLCLVVAPNLRSMDLGDDCGGLSLQEWVALCRKMPLMERLVLKMWPNNDEIQEQGLIPERDVEDEQRDKKHVEYIIDWVTFYDVLEL